MFSIVTHTFAERHYERSSTSVRMHCVSGSSISIAIPVRTREGRGRKVPAEIDPLEAPSYLSFCLVNRRLTKSSAGTNYIAVPIVAI